MNSQIALCQENREIHGDKHNDFDFFSHQLFDETESEEERAPD